MDCGLISGAVLCGICQEHTLQKFTQDPSKDHIAFTSNVIFNIQDPPRIHSASVLSWHVVASSVLFYVSTCCFVMIPLWLVVCFFEMHISMCLFPNGCHRVQCMLYVSLHMYTGIRLHTLPLPLPWPLPVPLPHIHLVESRPSTTAWFDSMASADCLRRLEAAHTM